MEQIAANLSGKTRRAKLNGREHIVAPLTLIVPGVLNGSKGPLFYPIEEITKNPVVWNGIPIVVYHPVVDGLHVSARDPGILDNSGIGVVFQARVNGKLTAEGWFDIERTRQIDLRVLNALERDEPFELSTGLFTDDEVAPEGSQYEGKSYTHIARNYRADHLAVLPEGAGACSVGDGCGVNVNKQSNGGSVMTDQEKKKLVDEIIANCDYCDEGDREQITALSDGKITKWRDSLASQIKKAKDRELALNAVRKGFTDPGGDTHTWNEKKAEWETKPKEEVTVNEGDETKLKEPPKNTEEWLKATNAPPETVAIVRNAEEITARERATVIGQLVANLKDQAKADLQEHLESKPLDELRKLMALVPEQVANAPSYAGAAAPVAARGTPSQPDEESFASFGLPDEYIEEDKKD